MSVSHTEIETPVFRETCYRCFRPIGFCYCALIQKIDSKIKFVILIHPLEVKRKIATGRMAHLCLANSVLIHGKDFSHNDEVNQILEDSDHHCVLLYPGVDAINISKPLEEGDRKRLFPTNKTLVIFVVDGTWRTAKKTVKFSQNLNQLPTICFTPNAPSEFRVRKQPAPECYSTIEAIHHVMDLLLEPGELAVGGRPHDLLLTLFRHMVGQQVNFSPKTGRESRKSQLLSSTRDQSLC